MRILEQVLKRKLKFEVQKTLVNQIQVLEYMVNSKDIHPVFENKINEMLLLKITKKKSKD